MTLDNKSIIGRPLNSKSSNPHIQERDSIAVLQVLLKGSHVTLSESHKMTKTFAGMSITYELPQLWNAAVMQLKVYMFI
jgi:hypothetical protein